MLIDTHAHVNFRSFKDDAEQTLQRALDAGIYVVNVGSQIDTSRQAVELAGKLKEGVYAAIGLHPEHTHSQYVDEEETHFKTREEDFNESWYEELVTHPKVVGIGECGLDYYRLPEDTSLHEQVKQKQIEVFKKQIRFAKKHNKALIVHSRPEKGSDELYEHMLQILKEELSYRGHPEALDEGSSLLKAGASLDSSALPQNDVGLRFVIHSYTHTPEFLQKFLDLGAFVSFNGIITFDKTGNMEKLVKMAPLDRILLETDCPYLAPVPMRGKRNEPLYVKYVGEKVAKIRNLSEEEISNTTTDNARRLFRI